MQKYNQNQLNHRLLCANGDVSVMHINIFFFFIPSVYLNFHSENLFRLIVHVVCVYKFSVMLYIVFFFFLF